MSVNVRSELERYEWTNATWTDRKLIAASPFRYDRTPSFFVWLEDCPETGAKAGFWLDSGAEDPYYASGGIVKLLAFLRNETLDETAEYLRDMYGDLREVDADTIELAPIRLRTREPPKTLPAAILDDYAEDYTYLRRRGIAKNVARMFRVKYDIGRSAIVIPWFMPDGRLGNIKYRSTRSKAFWYAKGGRPIREMVFGLDVVYRRNIKRAAIVEAEIDAMTLWSCGIPAIATGGSAFSEAKRDLILRSPLEELVVVRDNDEAGRKWQREITKSLRGHLRLSVAVVGSRYKDVNEALVAEGRDCIRRLIGRKREIKKIFLQKCAK